MHAIDRSLQIYFFLSLMPVPEGSSVLLYIFVIKSDTLQKAFPNIMLIKDSNNNRL